MTAGVPSVFPLLVSNTVSAYPFAMRTPTASSRTCVLLQSPTCLKPSPSPSPQDARRRARLERRSGMAAGARRAGEARAGPHPPRGRPALGGLRDGPATRRGLVETERREDGPGVPVGHGRVDDCAPRVL